MLTTRWNCSRPPTPKYKTTGRAGRMPQPRTVVFDDQRSHNDTAVQAALLVRIRGPGEKVIVGRSSTSVLSTWPSPSKPPTTMTRCRSRRTAAQALRLITIRGPGQKIMVAKFKMSVESSLVLPSAMPPTTINKPWSSNTAAQPRRRVHICGPGVNCIVPKSRISVVSRLDTPSKPPRTKMCRSVRRAMAQPLRLFAMHGPGAKVMVSVLRSSVLLNRVLRAQLRPRGEGHGGEVQDVGGVQGRGAVHSTGHNRSARIQQGAGAASAA
mmetsp:Transcript_20819/g.57943  ORF Transcript_20819/g.57943 Transcript_20819/m.57943 type:complete len:268 (-) Transcript_20819:873-1676(-)